MERANARAEILAAFLKETVVSVRDQQCPECAYPIRDSFPLTTARTLPRRLAECVSEVATKDYPSAWPQLLPNLVSTLVSRGDVSTVHNALLATRKLCKRFEFKNKDEGARLPLEEIVVKTFEVLRALLADFIPAAAEHPEAATLSKLILKIFWSCSQFTLPEAARQQPDYVMHWFDLVKAALECGAPVPLPTNRYDLDALTASPLWKLKKWAAQISARFLQRYGRVQYVEEPVRAFTRTFTARQAPQLLESCFGLLAASSRGCYVSPRVRQLCFTYVDSAVEIGALYKLMRPHLEFILFEACFPTMCATYEDIEQFEADPHEFVRKAHDPMEDFLEPRAAAMNLVAVLVRTRPMDVFEKLLRWLSNVLTSYETTPRKSRTLDTVRSKDGALCALGALSDELKKRRRYASYVDSILAHHVLPEILGRESGDGDVSNAEGLLRYRACWTLQQFANHTPRLVAQRIAECVHAALFALNDIKLPVRVEAAGAVRQLLASDHPGVDNLMRPALPQILEACFRIMGEIGSDHVVQALEIVIEKFGDEIAPYAVALSKKLAEAFLVYVAAGEDDDEASMAAAQCVEAMTATLNSIPNNDNNIYSEIEPHLVPVLVQIVGSRGGDLVEYFENAIDVLTSFTYASNVPFSRNLWALFELLVDAFHEWAYDYIPDLIRPFDNYVSRDPSTFLSGTTANGRRYVDKLTGVAARLLAPENLPRTCERDAIKATYVLLSIVHNCKGRVDDSVAAYARLVSTVVPMCLGPRPRDSDIVGGVESAPAPAGAWMLENGTAPWMPSLATALTTVWSSLLWYNAPLALENAASAGGSLDAFFNAWFNVTADSTRLSSLAAKCAILGFAEVLRVEAPRFAVLKPHALARIIELVGDDEPEPIAQNAAQQGDGSDYDQSHAAAGDEDEDDEDDDAEGAAFDEDVNDPDDEAYMAAIASARDENGSMRDAIASLAYAADIDIEDEDECYESPIDMEDERLNLFSALQLSQARGELEALVNGLPQSLRERVPRIFAIAERRAHEHAREQQRPVDNEVS